EVGRTPPGDVADEASVEAAQPPLPELPDLPEPEQWQSTRWAGALFWLGRIESSGALDWLGQQADTGADRLRLLLHPLAQALGVSDGEISQSAFFGAPARQTPRRCLRHGARS